jgi:DNA-binding GntR family transcriptional regulator
VGVAREALARLTADRFVRPQAHLGFTVADLSADALADVTLARVEVESLTFRLSVVHGDANWEASVVAAHHLLSLRDHAPADTGKYDDEWHRAHEAFHSALLAGCPSGRLIDMATGLRAEGELYRHWAERSPLTYERDVPGEHQALVDAALARDAERSAALMKQHISLTTQILLGDADLPLAELRAAVQLR